MEESPEAKREKSLASRQRVPQLTRPPLQSSLLTRPAGAPGSRSPPEGDELAHVSPQLEEEDEEDEEEEVGDDSFTETETVRRKMGQVVELGDEDGEENEGNDPPNNQSIKEPRGKAGDRTIMKSAERNTPCEWTSAMKLVLIQLGEIKKRVRTYIYSRQRHRCLRSCARYKSRWRLVAVTPTAIHRGANHTVVLQQ